MSIAPFFGKIVRTETFRAAAILVGVLHVCFLPCIWGNKSLLASAQDAPSVMPTGAWAGTPAAIQFPKTLDSGGGGLASEPWLALERYQYFHERVAPLWNPYQAYGRPLAANQQSQPFYPLTLALLLHVGPRSYNWFILSRLFVAGILSYLYLRFFVSFWPAVAGGITSMLAGYYVLFINMPQLSVEVLLPASLFSAEYLLRKRGYWSVAGFAILLLLVFLGGMPESALLLLTVLYTYIFFRIVSDADLRPSWQTAIARLAIGTFIGLALSAFFLLPFWELMHRSFDFHQPENVGGWVTGLVHDLPGLSILTYFFPLLYGPPLNSALGPNDFGLRNYVGLINVFLAAVASVAAFRKRKTRGPLEAVTWFFLCCAVLFALKRYGFPVVNDVGALPFFKLVNFPKYGQAIVSICVSMLAAIGVERLLQRELPGRVQAIALGLTALLIPVALLFSYSTLRNEILQLHVRRALPETAILIPALLMMLLAEVLVFFWRRGSAAGMNVRLAMWLVALASAEMWLNFIAPTYYWFNKLPRQTRNPYAGAPYVSTIKREQGNYRTFARDGVLFPNWASAFQLYDIRDLDAMYYNKYFPFIRNFFPDQKNAGSPNDLGDRFNGTGNYDLTAGLPKRLLQISSVKYIAMRGAFIVPNETIEEVLKQNTGHLIPGKEAAIERRSFILRGEARDALGEHPPYERLPYRIRVGSRSKEVFGFSYALDPFVFDKTSGDGVEFIVELKEPSGQITKQFSRYIDPKHNVQERRWLDGQVDLSAYRDQTVELLFTTTPGPRRDTSYDWAAWSNFHFQGDDAAVHVPASPFKLIYNGEVNLYRYDDVLPRAAVYHHAEAVQNEGEVLRRLADPMFDIFQSVVLDESALTADQRATVAEMNRETPVRVQTASIKSYKSQEVKIEASLDDSGILVLNDSNYPGWTVEVDGHPAEWINVNYMFRGVLLPSGRHSVRFVYQPKSFYWGLAISVPTMIGLIIIGVVMSRRRRRQVSVSPSFDIAPVH
jgi:hypothetical protein